MTRYTVTYASLFADGYSSAEALQMEIAALIKHPDDRLIAIVPDQRGNALIVIETANP